MKIILNLIKEKLAARKSVNSILAAFHKQTQALAALAEAKNGEGNTLHKQADVIRGAAYRAQTEADRAKRIQQKLNALIG